MSIFGTNNSINSKKTMFGMPYNIDEYKLLFNYNTQKQT